MRRGALVTSLLCALIMTACAKAPEPTAPEPPPAAAPNKPATAAPGPDAAPGTATLFPDRLTQLRMAVHDEALPTRERSVLEVLFRDQNRVIGVYDGNPYVTWLINAGGVWRIDPKGGGALLRYLPPEFKDGQVWKQRSGDADIWFRFARAQDCQGANIDQSLCWQLTVLNRGERTTFHFAPGRGPVSARSEHWSEPAQSFRKIMLDHAPQDISKEQHAAWVTAAEPATGAPAPVTPVTAAEFEQETLRAFQSAMAERKVQRGDLDGDAQQEYVDGTFDSWTASPVRFYKANGTLLHSFVLHSQEEQHRISRVETGESVRPMLFLYQHRGPGSPPSVSLAYSTGTSVEFAGGLNIKVRGTPGHRASVDTTGLLTVEWDMGDPARHTRVRRYRLEFLNGHYVARPVSTDFRPEGATLVYPSSEEDLIRAVFFARWFGLSDELPRYFADPAAAVAFGARKEITEPQYGPGAVNLGAITRPERVGPSCGKQGTAAPAPMGPDGTTGFLASWGGYEWFASAWGEVRFGKDPAGRPVILSLTLEGSCSD